MAFLLPRKIYMHSNENYMVSAKDKKDAISRHTNAVKQRKTTQFRDTLQTYASHFLIF